METKRERESESQRVREFIDGYITAALWSSVDDDETPLDDPEQYGEEKLAAETVQKMVSDCKKFISENEKDLDEYAQSRAIPRDAQYSGNDCAGHDFWMTRAGHGVGFWDRGLGELGERLSKASASFGECWLYVGDNGNLYTE